MNSIIKLLIEDIKSRYDVCALVTDEKLVFQIYENNTIKNDYTFIISDLGVINDYYSQQNDLFYTDVKETYIRINRYYKIRDILNE
jgi:hypothetical protein